MKKILIILLLIIFLVSGCGNKQKQLTYNNVFFASSSDGVNFEKLDNSVYKKGDKVYIIMSNVGKFEKDSNGINSFDIDVEVKYKDKVLISQTNLLGKSGKVNLENNIAKSPYGSFTSGKGLESGNYTFKMIIKDLVSGAQAIAEKDFELV